MVCNMLVDLKLKVDLFGNHHIVIDEKVYELNKRQYEDISYYLMKKEKKMNLDNYKSLNTQQIQLICDSNIICSSCPFNDVYNNCHVQFYHGELVVK